MRHDIPGYEGFYQIDDTDYKAYSLPRLGRGERAVKLRKDKKKYIHVTLSKNGIRGRYLYHRITATIFVPNPNNYDIVNHIDGDPSNFYPSNLEWCTSGQNQKHAYDTGLRRSPKGNVTKSSNTVYQFTLEGHLVGIHSSLTLAGRSVGVKASDIQRCVNNPAFMCKGFKWSYLPSGITPYKRTKSEKYFIDFRGQRKSAKDWCNDLGIKYNTLYGSAITDGHGFEKSLHRLATAIGA